MGGRAVSDDFGKAASAMGVLRCAPVLRRAPREDARHADSPQRDEPDGRRWRIGMPGTSERRALGERGWEMGASKSVHRSERAGRCQAPSKSSRSTRSTHLRRCLAPTCCRCSLFPAAVAENCRCLSGSPTRDLEPRRVRRFLRLCGRFGWVGAIQNSKLRIPIS